MTSTILETEADATRAAIKRALARYPDLSPDEVKQVDRYLRKDATAFERASIASDPDLHDKYRQFYHDQYFDRLRPFEIALVAAGVVAAAVVVLAIVMLRAG
jgi:hypothetical protein